MEHGSGRLSFQSHRHRGRGAYGKVFLAQQKGTENLFAVKVLRKDVLLRQGQVDSTEVEMQVMLKVDHPFLVGMS